MSEIYEKHMEIVEKHLDNYKKYYDDKNYPKASEFLWGTLNALFYAIGYAYGEKLSTYSTIKNFLPTLMQDYDLNDIKDQYTAAETLHANFYHDFMSEDIFEHNKVKVIELITKLSEILEERIQKINTIEEE